MGWIRAFLRERNVKGDDVTFADKLRERNERAGTSFFIRCLERGVNTKRAHAHTSAHLLYKGAYMPQANDTDGAVGERKKTLSLHKFERAFYILAHARGVASGSVCPANAFPPTKKCVDVIVAGSGCSHETHATSLEQGRSHCGAGAHNKGIGIVYRGGGDVRRRQRNHIIYNAPKGCLQVGNGIINNNFHEE